jgi:Arc/MetJ family transcription regulator
MNLALKATGFKTKKEVVEEGLKTLIIIKEQSMLNSLRRKLHWKGNNDMMRRDK